MKNRQTLPLVVLALAFAAGCGSSPATRFYVLESTVPPGATAVSTAGLTVGLGPIELPPYVDRDAIVTRSGGTTLNLAEFDRWAEPLQDGFERVLVQDLAATLGTASVEGHPWGAAPIDVRVPVEVLRFDSSPDGAATLVARWSIASADQIPMVAARTSTVTVAAEGAGFVGVTDALGRAIGRLAGEIAVEIRKTSQWSTATGAR